MQNQDPLSPMDNAQVTSQMAQINTVSGIEKLNTSVQGLSGQFMQMQALQGATLVGHDVVVPGDLLSVGSGLAQGGFELGSAADNVKVEVLAPSGQVLDTIDLGAQTSGTAQLRLAGRHGRRQQRPALSRHGQERRHEARRHAADARPGRRGLPPAATR